MRASGLLTRVGRVMQAGDKVYRTEAHDITNETAHDSTCRPDLPQRKDSRPVELAARIKSVKDIPGPSGLYALPYIGSAFLFHPFTKYQPEKSHLMFRDLYHKYGPIVKFRRGPAWSVLLFDPVLIEEIMSKEGKYPFRPSPPLADVYCSRTGSHRGISQLQGEEWMRMRRPVQDFMLQPSNINMYIPAMDEVANHMALTLLRQRSEDGRVPLSNIMLRYAIESSAVYCIDTKLGFQQAARQDKPESDEANNSHCPHQFRELTDRERCELMTQIKVYMKSVGVGYYTYPIYKFVRTRLYKDFEEACRYMSQVIETRVTEMAKLLEERGQGSVEGKERPHLLQYLLSDGRLDLKSCTSMLTGFFSTATDNVSNGLNILFWHLAKNTEKQTRLREEITRCVKSTNQVEHQVLSHMPYLKACLKESLRMTFPTPLGSVRVTQGNITLGGYHIPAGTSIHFGQNVLGHSDKYFQNPDQYLPERWLKQSDDDAALRRQRGIIAMPFGFGKRNCLGRRVAELQIYLAVIKVLQNFELELGDPHEVLDVVYKITASPSRPMDIRLHPLKL